MLSRGRVGTSISGIRTVYLSRVVDVTRELALDRVLLGQVKLEQTTSKVRIVVALEAGSLLPLSMACPLL